MDRVPANACAEAGDCRVSYGGKVGCAMMESTMIISAGDALTVGENCWVLESCGSYAQAAGGGQVARIEIEHLEEVV
jgi:hypothetical protein